VQSTPCADVNGSGVQALFQLLDLRATASIEKMNDVGGGNAIAVDAEEAVPENASAHAQSSDPSLPHLFVERVEALYR
jgi:hypothetical protein